MAYIITLYRLMICNEPLNVANFLKRLHSVAICTAQGMLLRHNCRYLVLYTFSEYYFSKQSVRTVQHLGKVCVLDIEIEGVKQIRNSDLNPILVFINPPSLEELERRLRGRKTETDESLRKRLNTAKIEMEYGIINNDVWFERANTN